MICINCKYRDRNGKCSFQEIYVDPDDSYSEGKFRG